jgi:hypothetical protein
VSNYDADRLYQLLPAVYRQRDVEQGYPLRDLVEILAGQAMLLEQDIFQLYENWFIETCEPWVVPYIGDLIGVRGTNGAVSSRAEVANTLGYRQAKGTAAMLERLTRDVTGWPARVVEYFERLETTQYANHVRLANLRTPDLRRANQLELLGGPFETANHTAEVRRIAVEAGRYNIMNVGLFLWRLQAYFVEKSTAGATAQPADGRYFFRPLGDDAPLFNRPQAETDSTQLAGEVNVPGRLRRRPLYRELEAARQSLADQQAISSVYFGSQPVFQVFVRNQAGDPLTEIPPQEILICDLGVGHSPVVFPGVWRRPPKTKQYLPSNGSPAVNLPIQVAVDPVLGRLAFPIGVLPAEVRVSYRYGFSDDLGGGPYQREDSFTQIAGETTFRVGESAGPGGSITIQGALDKWNGAGSAVIEILDSRTYAEALNVPKIPAKGRLEIRAADEQRPCLLLPGELIVSGWELSGFEINGLLVAGGPLHLTGQLDHIRLQHTTLAPGRSLPALIVDPGAAKVSLDRSILGAVRTNPETQVEISDSIVDAIDSQGKNALTAYAATLAATSPVAPDGTLPGGPLTVSRCTVIGDVLTTELALAENSLFLSPVTALRRQEGCVRFDHVPQGSRTPRRYHCQPVVPDGASAAEALALAAQVRPRFTSLRYGDPGYCQLTIDTASEIRRGAEDESEMGAFSSLKQPQREDGLRIRLDEYLRVGLEAGIFFAT